MSLHVAKLSFNVSRHLHPQLLIEIPLLLYLRCVRGGRKTENKRGQCLFLKVTAVTGPLKFNGVCDYVCVCAL